MYRIGRYPDPDRLALIRIRIRPNETDLYGAEIHNTARKHLFWKSSSLWKSINSKFYQDFFYRCLFTYLLIVIPFTVDGVQFGQPKSRSQPGREAQDPLPYGQPGGDASAQSLVNQGGLPNVFRIRIHCTSYKYQVSQYPDVDLRIRIQVKTKWIRNNGYSSHQEQKRSFSTFCHQRWNLNYFLLLFCGSKFKVCTFRYI